MLGLSCGIHCIVTASTPFERAVRPLTDILEATALIRRWIQHAGGPEQALRNDELVRSAVERQLLIISEAAIRASRIEGLDIDDIAPGIDWAGVRGIGNVLRHRYDDLDHEVIRLVVSDRLNELHDVVARALER